MSQKDKLLILLSDGDWHTNVEMNRICFRYSARLNDLRNDGHDITTNRINKGLFRYRLNSEDQGELF